MIEIKDLKFKKEIINGFDISNCNILISCNIDELDIVLNKLKELEFLKGHKIKNDRN